MPSVHIVERLFHEVHVSVPIVLQRAERVNVLRFTVALRCGRFHGQRWCCCRNRRIPVQTASNEQAKTVYHDALLLD